MKKIIIDPDNIDQALVKEAADNILGGGIVALPTETVYGLAVSSKNKDSVNRLYQLKQRPLDKPFSFVLGDIEEAVKNYFSVLPPFGYRMIEKLWPGPLTIIYYSFNNEVIGVRVPAHNVTRRILREVNTSVFLPSANISGEFEAVSAEQVEKIFGGDGIDLIVDTGGCLYSRPSTVISLTYSPFKILRSGVISERKIIEIFTTKRIVFVCTGNTCRSPMAQVLLQKVIMEDMPHLNQRYEIISRGIAANELAQISPEAVNVLKRKEDINVGCVMAKRLDQHTLLSSDLIFVMEKAQQDYVLKMEPSVEGRVFVLGKFLKKEQDIVDPIGKTESAYEQTYEMIKEAVIDLGDWL